MNTWIKRATNLTLIGGLCLAFGAGCVTGDEPPEDRPNDPDSCEEINSGDASGGATLSSDNCYQINNALNVSSGTLVIEAGTTVFMGSGSSINLSGTGRIEAMGEEDNEILIRGVEQERGFWAGIQINGTGTGNNVLEYVTIRHAGGARFTGASESKGAVYVRGQARLSVANSAFEENAYAGIHVDTDDATLALGSTSFSDNEVPLRLRPNQYAQIDADLDIAGNDTDTIFMSGGNASVTEGGTWPAYTYRNANSITLNADITIAAGATLEFAQDKLITLTDDAGSLNIAGTEADPVTLRSASGERGGWAGIHFDNASSSNNSINHAVIADGGGARYTGNNDHRGALFIRGDAARLSIENTTFENNAYAGLHISTGTGQVSLSSSSFINNEYPLLTRANHIGSFSPDLSFEENQHQVIALFYSDTGAATKVTRDATWPAFEVPVRFRATLIVEAHLTLSPGSIFEIESDFGVDIQGGRLTADASDADAIVFTGTEDLSGYWKGIGFHDSRFPNNQLINVELNNAGSTRWTGDNETQAALYLDANSRVTVADLTITNSGRHGIHVRNGAELVGCTGLDISGSAGEDFFGAVADATACVGL